MPQRHLPPELRATILLATERRNFTSPLRIYSLLNASVGKVNRFERLVGSHNSDFSEKYHHDLPSVRVASS
jgi:hypothetical protein